MRVLVLMTLVSCATVRKPSDPEGPPVVTYVGTAQGAALIIDAQNTRPYDLAESAMEKGMPTTLTKTDESVNFSAGNSYGYGVSPGGYAPADVVSTTGGWYAPTGFQGSLPPLGTTVVTSQSDGLAGVPTDTTANKIVPCPPDRAPATVAEQAACATSDVDRAMQAVKKLEE
ncbi:MAG: hypothetical protein WC654_06220 [Patescibacteria group bacterium]